jgi:sulfate adenylyltransferase
MAGRAKRSGTIIRRNCSAHFVVGREYGSPRGENMRSFYAPGAAQQVALSSQAEIGIEILPLEELVYVPGLGEHVPESEVPHGHTVAQLPAAELRRRLHHSL